MAVVCAVVFFNSVSEARAGEELDVLTRFLVFFNEGFGAVGSNSVRCGHDEDVFGARIGGDFDGWFSADEFNVWVFFAKISNMPSCSGVTGDNNNFSAPVG